MTSGDAGVAWSPVTQTIARSVGRSPSAVSSCSIVVLLDVRVLRMARRVGRLLVAEDEGVAVVEPAPCQLDAPEQVGDRVVRLGRVERLQPQREAQPPQERRFGREGAGYAVALEEARHGTRAAEPLQRDHVEPLALQASHDLAGPLFAGSRRALGFRSDGSRPKERMAIAKESVGVGDPLVRSARNAEHRLATPDVREREGQPVDDDPVAALDEGPGLVLVALGVGPSGQPPAVFAPLGRTKRGVGVDVVGAHLLPAPERLEDRPSGKLVGAVAEHRPVRDLARRRPPRADRVEQPTGAASGERVEIRRGRGLVAGSPAESLVRAVGKPVEKEDDDGKHGAEAIRAVLRRTYLRL